MKVPCSRYLRTKDTLEAFDFDSLDGCIGNDSRRVNNVLNRPISTLYVDEATVQRLEITYICLEVGYLIIRLRAKPAKSFEDLYQWRRVRFVFRYLFWYLPPGLQQVYAR